MKEIAPTLPVSDVEKAVEFYREKLAFSVGFQNHPVFALVRRGAVSIGLQLASQRRPAGTGSCYIWVDDVREIYNELSARGVEFADDIAFRDEYEMTDFVIHDPDGTTSVLAGTEGATVRAGRIAYAILHT